MRLFDIFKWHFILGGKYFSWFETRNDLFFDSFVNKINEDIIEFRDKIALNTLDG